MRTFSLGDDIGSGLTSGSGYVVAITDDNGGAKIYTYTASGTSASISDIQSKGTLFAELVGIDGTLQSSDFTLANKSPKSNLIH